MVVEIWRDQFTDAKNSRVQVEPRVHLGLCTRENKLESRNDTSSREHPWNREVFRGAWN